MYIPVIKGLLLIAWAAFAYNFARPFDEPLHSILLWLGILMLVVHILEFVFKRTELAAVDAGGVNGFVQTLLFGFAYWLPILKKP